MAKQRDRRKKIRGRSIRLRLIIGFAVPLIALVIVGVYAYLKTSDGLLSSYAGSAGNAISMTAELLDYGFGSISSESLQLFNNRTLVEYAQNFYADEPFTMKEAKSSIKNDITGRQQADGFVQDIFILTPKDITGFVTSGRDITIAGVYEKMQEDASGSFRSNDPAKAFVAYHPLLDEAIGFSSDSYIMSMMRELPKSSGLIVFDISAAKILEVLDGLSLGDDSIVAFVTADGRELLSSMSASGKDRGAACSFSDKDYYRDAFISPQKDYSTYVTVDGTEYLFMYSRCETSNSAVCALVPRSSLLSEASSIRHMMQLMIIISCAVAIFIGYRITHSISKNIRAINRGLEKASEGDLTVSFDDVEAKTEFETLADHIEKTLDNMCDLITDVSGAAGKVADSARMAGESSEALLGTSDGINRSASEISSGITIQLRDNESCKLRMDALSQELEGIESEIEDMKESMEEGSRSISEGSAVMNSLASQTERIGLVTDTLSSTIDELITRSREISDFVEVIDEITRQTRLLSLNASIEAARAGEAGRGFVVVAQQIGILAQNTIEASDKIKSVVDSVLEMTRETKKCSEETGSTVLLQKQTVSDTMLIFKAMDGNIRELTENIKEINKNMQQIDVDRRATVDAVTSTAQVTEQTAASTQTVAASIEMQFDEISKLTSVNGELGDLVRELRDKITRFTV